MTLLIIIFETKILRLSLRIGKRCGRFFRCLFNFWYFLLSEFMWTKNSFLFYSVHSSCDFSALLQIPSTCLPAFFSLLNIHWLHFKLLHFLLKNNSYCHRFLISFDVFENKVGRVRVCVCVSFSFQVHFSGRFIETIRHIIYGKRNLKPERTFQFSTLINTWFEWCSLYVKS